MRNKMAVKCFQSALSGLRGFARNDSKLILLIFFNRRGFNQYAQQRVIYIMKFTAAHAAVGVDRIIHQHLLRLPGVLRSGRWIWRAT